MPAALSVLIAVGARTTPVANGGVGSAHLAVMEQRRLQRSVDVYLSKECDVQVQRSAPTARDPHGKRMLLASERARMPKAGVTVRDAIEERMPAVAKSGREVMKDFLRTHPEFIKEVHNEDSDEDDMESKQEERKSRAVRKGVDANDLAALQAEFADELAWDLDDDEEGGDGDE